MKKIKGSIYSILLLFFVIGGLQSCEKDDTPAIEKLPPATQTGVGTFACLVNGEAFIHDEGVINCFYQYVDGGYYFGIGGNYENLENSNVENIYIETKRKQIFEGETYQLLAREDGNASGGGGLTYSPIESYRAFTNSNYTGELTITKLDFENNIISGTFWFNLKHPVTGDTIKIRQGRFDSHFYQ